MSISKILTLSNNYENAKEYGDNFFGSGAIDSDHEELKDKYYIWKYNKGSQDLKFFLYVDKEEKQYGYENKDYSVNISYANTTEAVILLDLADNMAFKYLIDNVEKIWKELNKFIPIAVIGFLDKERLANSRDNYVYVPNPTYGGSLDHICELVCTDLERKVSNKDYKVYFKYLKDNPALDDNFIEYLLSYLS